MVFFTVTSPASYVYFLSKFTAQSSTVIIVEWYSGEYDYTMNGIRSVLVQCTQSCVCVKMNR